MDDFMHIDLLLKGCKRRMRDVCHMLCQKSKNLALLRVSNIDSCIFGLKIKVVLISVFLFYQEAINKKDDLYKYIAGYEV